MLFVALRIESVAREEQPEPDVGVASPALELNGFTVLLSSLIIEERDEAKASFELISVQLPIIRSHQPVDV